MSTALVVMAHVPSHVVAGRGPAEARVTHVAATCGNIEVSRAPTEGSRELVDDNGRAVLRAALLRLRLDAGSPSSRKIAENANSRIQMNARRVPGQRIGEITQQQINDWLRTGTPARDFEHLWIVVADLTILARNAGMVQEYPPPSDKNWRKRWVALHGAARKTPDAEPVLLQREIIHLRPAISAQ